MPPEALGSDEASAKAFVRYWFEVLSQAMVTGDTEAVRLVSTRDCQTCASIPERIDNIYDKGGSLETNGWVVDRFVPDAVSQAGVRAYYVRVTQTPRALLDADGTVVDRSPRTQTPMRVVVESRRNSWVVQRLDVIR